MSTPMAVMDGMDGVVRPTAAGRMDGVGPALALSACAWAFCISWFERSCAFLSLLRPAKNLFSTLAMPSTFLPELHTGELR